MGGKGETTVEETTTYETLDPESAARMASVAESAQALAEEQWQTYSDIFAPYEEALVAANESLLPYYQEMMQAQYAAQAALTPYREEAARLGIEEIISDITLTRPLKEELVAQQLKELGLSEPVAEEFYRQALEGIDAEERAAQAQADVEQGFAGTRGIMTREMARAGVMPGSARHEEALEDLLYERARGIGGARTLARRGAEEESFGRLAAAMGARSGATGLSGIQSTASAAYGATPYQTAESQLGGYTLQSAADTAAQLYGLATQANVPGMTQYPTGTTTTTSGGAGVWDLAGQLAGLGLGSYVGGMGYGAAQNYWMQ